MGNSNTNTKDIVANTRNSESIVDPKNKTEEKEKIINQQDDNSYDESVTDNKPVATKKEETVDKNFEYTDSGEFTNDTQLTDTNSNDEYL